MDIKMKPNYTISHKPINRSTKAIIVSNYDGRNSITHWTYNSLGKARNDKYDTTDIGVWKIKPKNKKQ